MKNNGKIITLLFPSLFIKHKILFLEHTITFRENLNIRNLTLKINILFMEGTSK